ncbi:phytanoyl-CoA dioxygenase [Alishewanella agri BL06]|uniref:Phytanoyl-CoA dioxygenase n=1 Tax=Alishewanella agri BL06 TaxID=1195246 RepID=I9P5J7_9ALTE|nr:phytanoyl-CoA dioxygenase family protein [Alishewanella agri]EIW90267.1 phytanoyl-CoA dioxygenase [Alishewanella agri BL06]
MKNDCHIPSKSYGILEQKYVETTQDALAEQFLAQGFAVLDVGLSEQQIQAIKNAFDELTEKYIRHYGAEKLKGCDEYHTVRAPLLVEEHDVFLQLALQPQLLDFISGMIKGVFILNQQNAITNPSRQEYNQGLWHRDLPYQHFVTSRPIAINALYCVDDFTPDNGATFVLPFSHLREEMPSAEYVRQHATQVSAKAGQFILINCMTYHAGGYNNTATARRAVNHVFNIPFFKQQIKIPGNLSAQHLTRTQRQFLGFEYEEISSVDAFISQRLKRV